MIKHVSLKHGWYYFYRLHTTKLDQLCGNGFSKLHQYLEATFKQCPNEFFEKGPRSSKLRMDLGIKPTEIKHHEVCQLAEQGLATAHYGTAHSNVQMFMLQNDSTSIGMEIPIWLHPKEWNRFEKTFESKDPLSGHIDVLRIEGDKVWVWDFKPNADKEKYATTQTFFYAFMLSQRSGIPLDKFMCGYFDEKTSFVFKPELKWIDKSL
ncbi:MAG TPA: PD-(D/E)XK nuclease family protein [Candidatus Nanoarchaeia archaeon]|nr:PD-(D/E)XK nuclease family protein [Candidatus Nanoarchaeia archaeon]